MDNKSFLIHAKSVSNLNALILKERMGIGHFLLLTEIVARRIKGKSLPNVKWLQTELRISFTKVKSIIEYLESKGLITKVSDAYDKRRKLLDVTDEGDKYINKLIASVEQYSSRH